MSLLTPYLCAMCWISPRICLGRSPAMGDRLTRGGAPGARASAPSTELLCGTRKGTLQKVPHQWMPRLLLWPIRVAAALASWRLRWYYFCWLSGTLTAARSSSRIACISWTAICSGGIVSILLYSLLQWIVGVGVLDVGTVATRVVLLAADGESTAELFDSAGWLQEPHRACAFVGVAGGGQSTEVTEVTLGTEVSDQPRARAHHRGPLRPHFPRVTPSPGNPGASVLSGRRPRVL